jgi:YD repeat-containing protein
MFVTGNYKHRIYMNRFTLKNFLVLALSATVLFSCSKDDDKAANPNNPSGQKCRITSDNENNGEEESIYEYDSQGRLIKQSYKEGGKLEPYYETYEYNNAGYISKITEWDSAGVDGYELYTYNTDGRPTRREVFYDDGSGIALQSINTYEYNESKRLIRRNRYDGSTPNVIDEYQIITYPTGNTARDQSFSDMNNDGTPELESTTDYTFDDKKSPQLLLGVAFEDEFISEHNSIKEVYSYPGNPSASRTRTYTYEYNAEGFPTKMIGNDGSSTPWVVTFSYICN